MPISEVIRRMGRGDVVQHSVVVPEGLTSEETFQLFLDAGVGTPEAFRAAFADTDLLPGLAAGAPNLEGFLFPETYRVTRSNSARQVVERMLEQFRRRFTPELRDRARALGLTPRQAVTLASIVQKETGLQREAPIVAGVYLNRLDRGMRLQADPTVTFALKRDGRWTGVAPPLRLRLRLSVQHVPLRRAPSRADLQPRSGGPRRGRLARAHGVLLFRRRRERRAHLLADLRTAPSGHLHEPAPAHGGDRRHGRRSSDAVAQLTGGPFGLDPKRPEADNQRDFQGVRNLNASGGAFPGQCP